MSFGTFILIVALSFATYQGLVIFFNMQTARKYRRARFQCSTQERFGILRHRLITSAVNGEVGDRSVTFLNFYLIYTYIIRNPDQYEEIAEYLSQNLVRLHDTRERSVEAAMEKESQTWSSSVRVLANDTANAIEDLMIFNTFLIRVLHNLGKRMRGTVDRFARTEEAVPLTGLIGWVANFSDVDTTFLETRDRLHLLAGTVA